MRQQLGSDSIPVVLVVLVVAVVQDVCIWSQGRLE